MNQVRVRLVGGLKPRLALLEGGAQGRLGPDQLCSLVGVLRLNRQLVLDSVTFDEPDDDELKLRTPAPAVGAS